MTHISSRHKFQLGIFDPSEITQTLVDLCHLISDGLAFMILYKNMYVGCCPLIMICNSNFEDEIIGVFVSKFVRAIFCLYRPAGATGRVLIVTSGEGGV